MLGKCQQALAAKDINSNESMIKICVTQIASDLWKYLHMFKVRKPPHQLTLRERRAWTLFPGLFSSFSLFGDIMLLTFNQYFEKVNNPQASSNESSKLLPVSLRSKEMVNKIDLSLETMKRLLQESGNVS